MRKISAVFLTLVMLLTMISPAMAAESALQHNYSSAANSGIRHEVCTTLAGTTVGTYYTGNYSFDKLATQSGDALPSVMPYSASSGWEAAHVTLPP